MEVVEEVMCYVLCCVGWSERFGRIVARTDLIIMAEERVDEILIGYVKGFSYSHSWIGSVATCSIPLRFPRK